MQPLEEFDGSKLSCREGLARHTQRRKERQARKAAARSVSPQRGPAKRAQRAKRALEEAAAQSPRGDMLEEEAAPVGSAAAGAEDGSRGPRQRRRLTPAPAGEQPPLPQPQAAAPMQPAPRPQAVFKHHPQLGQQRQQLQRMGQQPRQQAVLHLASRAHPLLTPAEPAPAAASLLPPAVQPPAGPRATAPPAALPVALQQLAAQSGPLQPLLLPPSKPLSLDSIPSLLLAPLTPHQSLTPEDASPACSEPMPPAVPGAAPRAEELLVHLLVQCLQRGLQVRGLQAPPAPPSAARFGPGAPGSGLPISLLPPDSPIEGHRRRSAFHTWRPAAAAGSVPAASTASWPVWAA